MAAAPPPSCHLLHFLRMQPAISPSPASFVSFLKPILVSSSSALSARFQKIHMAPLRKALLPSLSHPPISPFRTSFSSSSLSVAQTNSTSAMVRDSAEKDEDDDNNYDGIEQFDEEIELADDELDSEDDGIYEEIDLADDELDREDDGVEQFGEEIEPVKDKLETEGFHFENTQMGLNSTSSEPLKRNGGERSNLPNLTVKERKELVSYAHSLGRKLKMQLVGKLGVTSNVATSFSDALEANELLKIKIHRTCPGELDDVVKQLEEATGSVAVGKIGRTVIIYRPSLSKLKVEEKKKQIERKRQARKVPMRKHLKPRWSREEVSKFSRRGSSRGLRNSKVINRG